MEKIVRQRSLYEINVRVWLRNFDKNGKKATLSDVPNSYWDYLADLGIENVWLMGVWKTPEAAIKKYCFEPFLIDEYKKALKDFTYKDVSGSPYSIEDYIVSEKIGGENELVELKKTLNKRGMNLILDFIPNHFSAESSLVVKHPEIFLKTNEHIFKEDPYTFFKPEGASYFIAHGRDPFFPAWTDTAQINYFEPEARNFMINRLKRITELADGVRCDMAMLMLNNVFRNTWGIVLSDAGYHTPDTEFWQEAIHSIKNQNPNFLFIAEAYWDLEWQLQQLGFDYTYDKSLMDRLKNNDAGSIRDHLRAEEDYQLKSVRFIENHDEPRAINYLGYDKSKAAAIIISTIQGMRFYFDGQFEGERTKLPVQLGRKPKEKPIDSLKNFYEKLLRIVKNPIFKYGDWRLITPEPAWENDYSYINIIAFLRSFENQYRLVVVNYSTEISAARLKFEPPEGMEEIILTDLLTNEKYKRNTFEIFDLGLYVKLSPFQSHLFAF